MWRALSLSLLLAGLVVGEVQSQDEDLSDSQFEALKREITIGLEYSIIKPQEPTPPAPTPEVAEVYNDYDSGGYESFQYNYNECSNILRCSDIANSPACGWCSEDARAYKCQGTDCEAPSSGNSSCVTNLSKWFRKATDCPKPDDLRYLSPVDFEGKCPTGEGTCATAAAAERPAIGKGKVADCPAGDKLCYLSRCADLGWIQWAKTKQCFSRKKLILSLIGFFCLLMLLFYALNMTSSHANLQEEKVRLGGDLNAMRNNFNSSQNEKAKFVGQISEQKKKLQHLDELEKKYTNSQQEKTKIEAERAKAQKSILTLQQQISAKDNELKDYIGKLKTLESRAAEASTNVNNIATPVKNVPSPAVDLNARRTARSRSRTPIPKPPVAVRAVRAPTPVQPTKKIGNISRLQPNISVVKKSGKPSRSPSPAQAKFTLFQQQREQPFEMPPNSTVGELRERITSYTGLSPSRQDIFHINQRLSPRQDQRHLRSLERLNEYTTDRRHRGVLHVRKKYL